MVDEFQIFREKKHTEIGSYTKSRKIILKVEIPNNKIPKAQNFSGRFFLAFSIFCLFNRGRLAGTRDSEIVTRDFKIITNAIEIVFYFIHLLADCFQSS